MLLRMQIPPCSHGGSHFALGSKTNPSATPRGASEPAEQIPTRATKTDNNSTGETRRAEVMFGYVFSFYSHPGRGSDRDTRPVAPEEKVAYEHRDFCAPSAPLHAEKLTYGHGGAGRGSVLDGVWGLVELEIHSVW